MVRLWLGKPPFKPDSRKGRKYARNMEAIEIREDEEDVWEFRGKYETGFEAVEQEMEMEI